MMGDFAQKFFMYLQKQIFTFIKLAVLYRIGDVLSGILRAVVHKGLNEERGCRAGLHPEDPEVEPFINATVDRCFEDALVKAREVDSLITSGKYTMKQLAEEKPLLGLPISVKCLLMVKGLRCTAGCKYFAHQRAIEDAPSVALMKKAGAIVIATTNVPEAALYVETFNNVYGLTRNPFDTNRTCGGSSGGEGALIGAGASLFGLGNDLLGSVRIPAHFNGIFSHKPTRGLVPIGGSFPPQKPSDIVSPIDPDVMKCAATGPMCRYAEDLIVSMRILSSESDAKVNFGQKVNFEKLKIIYLKDFYSPLVQAVEKDIATGLTNAVSYFEKTHKVPTTEVKMPWLLDANRCTYNIVFPFVGSVVDLIETTKGSPLNVKWELLKSLFGKSKLSFGCLFAIISSDFPLFHRKSYRPYYKKMAERWTERFDQLLDENTVLLLPTLPNTAPFVRGSVPFILGSCYTGIFNILGLPVTHCQLGFNKEGLPYGIQIVGCNNNDALTIACAVELEKAFGGWKSPGEV
ncbi:fatty-acid amide hydrolase 2-B [Caerostris darwini]|uniref:Fatty-acid amide hydrolase 2-B n=1 Tax=Caerostris darwini TaxID=1538125 RepID=A0AAV4TU91_9ARAC|nr:fatty-acid amide hydrolase 2-B [Caerostris darwini]